MQKSSISRIKLIRTCFEKEEEKRWKGVEKSGTRLWGITATGNAALKAARSGGDPMVNGLRLQKEMQHLTGGLAEGFRPT